MRESAVPEPLQDGSSRAASICAYLGSVASGRLRKSAHAAAMQRAPAAAALAVRRLRRCGSLSKASTRPRPPISAACRAGNKGQCAETTGQSTAMESLLIGWDA